MNAIKTPDVARVTPANLIQLFLSFSSLIIFLSFRLNVFLSGENRFPEILYFTRSKTRFIMIISILYTI